MTVPFQAQPAPSHYSALAGLVPNTPRGIVADRLEEMGHAGHAAALRDPTIASLKQFDDPSKWVVVRNVPVFREHIATLPDGTPKPITKEELALFARESQRLEHVEGVLPRITIGHTLGKNPETGAEPKETEQPPIVGYARNAQTGLYGKSQKPAVLMDYWIRRDQWDQAKQHPFRSPEVYLNSRQITGIALLTRDPKLDMGMLIYGRADAPAISLPQQKSYYFRDDGLSFYAMDDEASGYAAGRSDYATHQDLPPAAASTPSGFDFNKFKSEYKPPSFGFDTSAKWALGGAAAGMALGDKPAHALGTAAGGYAGEKLGESVGTAIGAAGGPIGSLGGRIIGGIGGSMLGSKLTQDAAPESPTGVQPAGDPIQQLLALPPDEFEKLIASLVAARQKGEEKPAEYKQLAGGFAGPVGWNKGAVALNPVENLRRWGRSIAAAAGEPTDESGTPIFGKKEKPSMNAKDGQRTDYGLLGAAGGGLVGNHFGGGLGTAIGDIAASAFPAHAAAIKAAAPVLGKAGGTLIGANAGSDIENRSRAYAAPCGATHMADEPNPAAGPAPEGGGGDEAALAALQDQIMSMPPEEFEATIKQLVEMYQQGHAQDAGQGGAPQTAAAQGAPPAAMHRTDDMIRYARQERRIQQLESDNQRLQQFAGNLTAQQVVGERAAQLRTLDNNGFTVYERDFAKATKYQAGEWTELLDEIQKDRPRSHKADERHGFIPTIAEGTDANLPADRTPTRYESSREMASAYERTEKVLAYMRKNNRVDYDECDKLFDKRGTLIQQRTA